MQRSCWARLVEIDVRISDAGKWQRMMRYLRGRNSEVASGTILKYFFFATKAQSSSLCLSSHREVAQGRTPTMEVLHRIYSLQSMQEKVQEAPSQNRVQKTTLCATRRWTHRQTSLESQAAAEERHFGLLRKVTAFGLRTGP